jgi:hypothetical protein
MALCLAVGLVAAGQDPNGRKYEMPGPRGADACDMKKIEQAPWCESCGGLLDDKQKEEHKAKEYKEHKIKQAKACVKKYYHAECHLENSHFDKGECCGKAKEERVLKSALYWLCEGCGYRANDDKEKCPIDDCPKKKMRQECTLQPSFPHCNEKWWREEQKKKKK